MKDPFSTVPLRSLICVSSHTAAFHLQSHIAKLSHATKTTGSTCSCASYTQLFSVFASADRVPRVALTLHQKQPEIFIDLQTSVNLLLQTVPTMSINAQTTDMHLSHDAAPNHQTQCRFCCVAHFYCCFPHFRTVRDVTGAKSEVLKFLRLLGWFFFLTVS